MMENRPSAHFYGGWPWFWTSKGWHVDPTVAFEDICNHCQCLYCSLCYLNIKRISQGLESMWVWVCGSVGVSGVVTSLSQATLQFVSYLFFLWSIILKTTVQKPWHFYGWEWNITVYFKLQIKKQDIWAERTNMLVPLSLLTSLVTFFPQMAFRVNCLQDSFLHENCDVDIYMLS